MCDVAFTGAVFFFGLLLVTVAALSWMRTWRRCCMEPIAEDMDEYFRREYGEGLSAEELRREIDRAKKEADDALMSTDAKALAKVYARLGHYHSLLEETDQAKTYFTKAAKLGNPFGYLHLAEMAYLADLQDECLKNYRELAHLVDDDSSGFFERVYTLLLERVQKEKPQWDARQVEDVVRLFYARVNH